MQYKCPQCGQVSDKPGNCPQCNVPLVEANEGEAKQPMPPVPPPQQ